MEVSVLTNSGLPEGCILSIRSGSVRRQAPMSSGKAFKFPAPLSNPMKFDIFMPVATGHLVTRPGEEQYKVELDGDGLKCCEVQVRNSEAGGAKALADESPKKESSVAGAKEFLEQHAILEFVQAVLHTIITERPKDPYLEMARHFMCGYKATDLKTDPAGVSMAPKAAGKAPPDAKDILSGAVQEKPQVVVDSPPTTLMHAGALAKGEAGVCRSSGKTGNVIRRTTTDVLLRMNDGTEVWHDVEDVGQPAVSLAMARDAGWGGTVAVTSKGGAHGSIVERTTTEMRVRMEDGTETWHAVEDIVHVMPQATQALKAGDEVVRLRDTAKGTVQSRTSTDVLVRMADGSEEWQGLEDVAKAPGAKVNDPRDSADSKPVDVPVAAPIDSKPREAPMAAPKEDDKPAEPKAAPGAEATGDELRVLMKDKLLDACDTGELQSALETVVAAGASRDVELRTQMRTCLIDACENGQLTSVLDTVVAPVKVAKAADAPVEVPVDAAKEKEKPAEPPKDEEVKPAEVPVEVATAADAPVDAAKAEEKLAEPPKEEKPVEASKEGAPIEDKGA